MEFLRSFLRRHLAGKPVVASPNVGCFLRLVSYQRGCLHDTGATFAPERVHSGSLSWLYICLHDTTTKCYAAASHPGSRTGARISLRYEISQRYHVKPETTKRFGVKSVCR